MRSVPRTALKRSERNWLSREGGSLSGCLLKRSNPPSPRDLFCSRPLANGDGSKTRTRLSPRAQTFSPTTSPTALGQSSALSVRKTNHESARWQCATVLLFKNTVQIPLLRAPIPKHPKTIALAIDGDVIVATLARFPPVVLDTLGPKH